MLISIVIVLVVCGVCLALLDTLPIDRLFKIVIRVVVVLALCVYLLSVFGIYPLSLPLRR